MDQFGEIQKLLQLLADQGRLPIGGPFDARSLLGLLGGPGEPPGLYWDARHPAQGGTQRVLSSLGAPSADYYRLVGSLDEAASAFGRGDKPLLVGGLQNINPDEIEPGLLRKFQEDQWAAPGGVPLFTDQGINPHHRTAWEGQQSAPAARMPQSARDPGAPLLSQ